MNKGRVEGNKDCKKEGRKEGNTVCNIKIWHRVVMSFKLQINYK